MSYNKHKNTSLKHSPTTNFMKPFTILSYLVGVFLLTTEISCSNSKVHSESSPGIEGISSTDPDKAHNSRNSLDWFGVYSGITPCANCEGIETSIALKRDGTFRRTLKYLGKDVNPIVEEDKFEWNSEGSKIILPGEAGISQMYQVGENVLFHLDQEGNRITGDLASMYRLEKNRVDYQLEDKKWELTELRGQTFEKREGQKEGIIEFNMETGRFAGINTCNNFFGQYELMEGDRIKFGPAGSTRMGCPGNETEQTFMEVLNMVDNYSVEDGILSLNKGKMAPLARFKIAQD